MEGILKYSALNPLATCFFPPNFKKSVLNNGKSEPMEENEVEVINQEFSEAVIKFKTEVHSKSKGIKQLCALSYPAQVGVTDSKYKVLKNLNENLYFTKRCFTSSLNATYLTITDVGAFLRFILLTLLDFYYNSRAITYDATDIDKKIDFSSKTDEGVTLVRNEEITTKADGVDSKFETCGCPPMFGCIIPPTFFGNPFNLESSCTKECVHVCHYTKKKNGASYLRSNFNTKDLFLKDLKQSTKLEQYSSQMHKIAKDVCNIASLETDNDIAEDTPYSREIVKKAMRVDDKSSITVDFGKSFLKGGCFGAAEVMPCEADRLNFENLMLDMEIPKDSLAILEDYFHPLLDEGISMQSYYEGISPEIEKTESQFSPRYRGRLSFDPEELSEKTICNPPCSVWCDSLPQSAKNTYRKFIESLSSEQNLGDYYNIEIPERLDAKMNRPTYKRSFSANDCLKQNSFESFYQCLDPSSIESTFFYGHVNNSKLEQSNHMLKEYNYLPLNENFSILKSNGSNLHSKNIKSGMWGPFDGEDSLWKSLPECVQPFDRNLRQSSHKRVRELKRQRSLS